MKFPIEYADKLLFVDKTIRSQEYMVGSMKYGHLTYQCHTPYITLEQNGRDGLHSLYADKWVCDLIRNIRLDKADVTFNAQVFSRENRLGQWSVHYIADFIGDINSFLEDATLLWFRHQN